MVITMTSSIQSFRFWVKVNGQVAQVFFDSGTFENFISFDFASQHNIQITDKSKVYGLLTFKSTLMMYNNGQVNKKTVLVELQLG